MKTCARCAEIIIAGNAVDESRQHAPGCPDRVPASQSQSLTPAQVAALAWLTRTDHWTALRMLTRCRQGPSFRSAAAVLSALKRGDSHTATRDDLESIAAAHHEAMLERARLAAPNRIAANEVTP